MSMNAFEEMAKVKTGVQKSSNAFDQLSEAKKAVHTPLYEDVLRGITKSSLVTPFVKEQTEEADTFSGRTAEMAGELVGDIPAMSVGGAGGALGGAALGSIFGPVGTAIGGLLGGGAGALAAPTAVKSIAREVKRGSPLDEAAERVITDVAKSGLIGGATAGAGKLAGPLLGRVGGKVGQKVLSTGVGRGLTEAAGEVGGMTYGQKLTGEDITPEGVAQNVLLMGGMKGAHALAGKLPIRKPVEFDASSLVKEPSVKQKEAFNKVRDYVGDRASKVFESQVKWQDKQADYEKKHGKATSQNLEDMIYYRQRTAGPKEGDSFESVRERLPEHWRNFVDKEVGPHLENSLKEWNDNPYTKDINPREALKDIYLPGLYEGTEGEFDKAMATLSNRFKTKNPFANEKTFLTYNDALVKAGLKPKYKNIVDLIKHYDKVMIKSAANAEFASRIKGKDIIRPNNRKAYEQAKRNGWVPFNDPFLRRSIVGKSDTGKFIFSTSEMPAMINPEIAPVLEGIFSKDAYRPDSKALKYFDAASDRLKQWAVHLPFVNKIPGFKGSPFSILASPFHAWTLTEHAVADPNFKLFGGLKAGKELLKSKESVSDYLKHGGTLGRADIGKDANYLFGTMQPAMKLASYHEFVNSQINKLAKAGNPPSEAEIKAIKHDAASFTNNVYGGQNWELLNWFNNKENLKKARRATGYLDWSVSNIRNVAQAFGTGPQAEAAKKMWANYGLFYLGSRAIIDAFNSSLVQTDDKNKSPLGIRLDPEKFMENLSLFGKPGQRLVFSLPDVDVKLGGWDYNPGRDERGKRQYGHFGKSAFEVGHYFTKPISELFSKSNPVFQQIYKQVTGTTPTEYGPFLVQKAYKSGQQVPWEGKEGVGQAVARGKELAQTLLPFSMRADTVRHIPKKYLSSGMGMIPINKGLTPFKAAPDIRNALKKNDIKALNEIKQVLLYNGYTTKEIHKKIQSERSWIKKHG